MTTINLSSAKQQLDAAVKLAKKCKAGIPAQYMDLPTLMYPFLNLAPEDKLLYLSWIAYTLVSPVERYPQILLVLEGPSGSGKTTLSDYSYNYLEWLRKTIRTNTKAEVNFFSPRTVTSDKVVVHDGMVTQQDVDDACQDVKSSFDCGYKAAIINGVSINITDPLLANRTLKLTMPPLQDQLPLKELHAKYDLVLGAIYALYPQFMYQAYMEGPEETTITTESEKRAAMSAYEHMGRLISNLLYNDEHRFLDQYLKTQF